MVVNHILYKIVVRLVGIKVRQLCSKNDNILLPKCRTFIPTKLTIILDVYYMYNDQSSILPCSVFLEKVIFLQELVHQPL